jgi:crotonobetainyl-CoA:carnitine CoA-transferase CaiB-like acyl-CoA transferase
VNDLGEVFADPQVRHRALRREVAHPRLGTLPIVASPIRLSETPVAYETPPPLLGEHTFEVLREWASLEDSALEELEAGGAIAQWRAR